MTQKIAYKYLGGGFVAGIPARDLTTEEAKEYGKKLLLATGLYVEPKQTQVKKDGK